MSEMIASDTLGRDCIILSDASVHALVGCYPEERIHGQNLIITARIYLDLQPAGETDDLEHSICYVSIYDLIKAVAKARQYMLIESLAESICTAILDRWRQVTAISLHITKPYIPAPDYHATTSIQIYRTR